MQGISLFSGIGGLDLGLREAAGVRTVCYVEWDKYCQQVLQKRMQEGFLDDAPIWSDIRSFDGRPWAGRVDIVFGGFPCQDISTAGKRAGIKKNTRSGLWFEMLRLISEIRPKYVFLENVSAITIRGIDVVLGGLSEAGYDARWTTLRASDVGARHKRERWFCLAYSESFGTMRESGPVCEANGGSWRTLQGELKRTSEMAYSPCGMPRQPTKRQGGQDIRGGSEESMAYSKKTEWKCAGDSWGRGFGFTDGSMWDFDPADLDPSAFSDLGRIFNGFSERMDAYLNMKSHNVVLGGFDAKEDKKQEDILPILRKTIREKEDKEQARRLFCIQAKEILRQILYEPSLLEEESHKRCLTAESSALKEEKLRDVSDNAESEYPPQRWEYEQQFYRELDDIVRSMSYKMALDEWEEITEDGVGLCNLWGYFRANEEGSLPETLSTLKEVWQSQTIQEKRWSILCSCGGYGIINWPYTPRVASNIPRRVDRLKCLGNAVVPAQAAEAWRRLTGTSNRQAKHGEGSPQTWPTPNCSDAFTDKLKSSQQRGGQSIP